MGYRGFWLYFKGEPLTIIKYNQIFEELYKRLNKRDFVHPDPLEFLYRYEDPRDREVVGLFASSLAYGRVAQILKSVSSVLDVMGPRPSLFIMDSSEESLTRSFSGFKHRFSTGEELSMTILGTKRILEEFGSLEACFVSGMNGDDTVQSGLINFARELSEPFGGRPNSLIPCHDKKSSMKRLNLFLRWMVRRDDVDPGGWSKVPAEKLIVPLDVHMMRICAGLGITKRRCAGMRTALDITESFRRISPADPVKYDFALTRLGIKTGEELDTILGSSGQDLFIYF
jgi:uncharacterized protein (TIGR02757 family)